MLEKIIYIADYIEPNREKAPNLAKIRQTAFYDIDECMYEILRDTLEYLGKILKHSILKRKMHLNFIDSYMKQSNKKKKESAL